ncbi:MAG: RnfABCDGE type electron transport complex subunit B [Ruminococcaceae bacterium]|nr:RnfABCDGE type electron transport complex subunit B [Oscillospiraceae bacterium]
MTEILFPTLAIGALGLAFGAILAVSSIIFKVDKDERIEKIEGILPGANCGGCGYAGCAQFAKAIVEEGAPINKCNLMTEGIMREICDIMGVEETEIIKKYAVVKCKGDCNTAKDKYELFGVDDCVTAFNLGGGPKKCEFGCMGLGSCVKVCSQNAITIENGVAKIDPEKCGGCGECKEVCPKNVIDITLQKQKVFVKCNSTDKGVVVKDNCQAGCIGCMICVKNCEHDAIKVENFLAKIDYEKCVNCGKCAEVCPKKVIEII